MNQLDIHFNNRNPLDGFFNTNHEKGDQLKASQIKAGNQDGEILNFFTQYHYREFTPDEVETHFKNEGKMWPITSVRRAINTLTKGDYLDKLDTMRIGGYGKLTHTWKLKASKI